MKLFTWTWAYQFHQRSKRFRHRPSIDSIFKYSQEITFFMKGKEKEKNTILSGYVTCKDGICNAQELINDEIIERQSKIYRRGSRFSDCTINCQCCKERFQVITSSVEWHRRCYVQFSIFSCAQNNESQQNLGEIWNSWTPEIYTSPPIRGDLRNKKIVSAA